MIKLNAFTGASGTGKSTLLEQISKKYLHTKVIELSGRPYLPTDGDYISNKSDSINRRINYGSLVTFTEAILSTVGYDTLFFSRCAIDRLAYIRTLDVGRDLEDITIKEIKEIVIPFINVFYLPVEFDLPKCNDVIRGNNEEIRKETDKNIKLILDEFNINYIHVSGTVENRLNIINSFLK